MTVAKFLQSIGDNIYKTLETEAEKREISVQELIRCVIVPDWLEKQGLTKKV